MNVTLELTTDQLGGIARAVVAALEEQGKVMVQPEREEPYTCAEAAEKFRVSKDTVSRWGEAGLLDRVPGTSRVLFTADSVRKKMRGEK